MKLDTVKVQKLLVKQGLEDEKALAKKAGISTQTLTFAFSHFRLTYATLYKIAEALKEKPENLLVDDGSQAEEKS